MSKSKKSKEKRTPPSNDSDGILAKIGALVGGKTTEASPRALLEEYVETTENGNTDSASAQERALLLNILKLRDVKAVDVMIPRADIVAVDIDTKEKELLSVFAQKHLSRLPVYKGTLDNVVGSIHVKDVLIALVEGKPVKIKDFMRGIPVVSPAMDLFDLILDMREKKRHMVLVVDEYGGIDGLVTINDVIEEIVGDISDEHDREEDPEMVKQPDGSVIADARVSIDEFESEFGKILTQDEREENDTLGGLVSDLAGRVPIRGEILTHKSGTVFEVMDSDPRRVRLLKIRNIP